jgi:putative FmdB family regulatory protein
MDHGRNLRPKGAGVRRYDYRCDACEQQFDIGRPVDEAGEPADCPFCGSRAHRIYTAPKFLFKADPNDVRPVWHNHGAFGHAHPPRRGIHPPGVEEH